MMQYEYSGNCRCGRLSINISLPQTLNNYTPRACDCGFCRERGIRYLSDSGGMLEIVHGQPVESLQQGSLQARFLCCSECGTVVAAVCDFESGLKGAVNAGLLDQADQLRPSVPVSPKRLGPDEKIARWETLWSPAVIKCR
jgi:hypothetical protein